MRTTKPESGNKFFNTISNGGWSQCIVGYPTDKDCNVASNTSISSSILVSDLSLNLGLYALEA